jgi:hypothetical protein
MVLRSDRRRRSSREPRRRPRAVGCAIWLLVAVVIVLLLSLIFGGFQKGTKTGSGSLSRQRLQPAAQEIALGRVAGEGDRGRVGVGRWTSPVQPAQEVSPDRVE